MYLAQAEFSRDGVEERMQRMDVFCVDVVLCTGKMEGRICGSLS